MLSKRKEDILSNLEQAVIQTAKIEQNYLNAQNKYTKASEEVIEISRQTKESIKEKQEQNKIKIAADLQRLQNYKESIIYYQKQKIQKQIFQEFIDLSIIKIHQNFKKELKNEAQDSINILFIKQLAQYNN